MKKLHNLFFVFALLFCSFAFAQQTITGKVMDQESMPLPGASVVVQGTTVSATTGIDGDFTLSTSQTSGTIVISYVGYAGSRISFNVAEGQTFDAGTITLAPDAEQLEGLVIIGGGVIDLVEDRKTPVAVSTITRKEIQEKSGNQEFPEIMKNTPSIYIAGAAGGAGDSQMYTRGFDQTNTAFLLNGQPINGMEDGNMYWSNWSGMTDVANAVQIQRGLGSSKLAISSVGGTINIVTKATDLKQGGFAQSIMGNDNYMKNTVGYSTGLMESGWGVTAMLTNWSQDGYNRGTYGAGQNYFVSVGFKPNDKHQFNFLIFGAPQWHDQNYTKSIATYLEHGRKYNNNYGFIEGDYLSERRNFYHKPVANLNWDFKISETMDLSTVAYASWGRGGGTGNWGNGRVRTAEGLIDFDAIRANNEAIPGGIGTSAAYAIRNSVNNHAWYGVVSNFNHKINENLSYNVGLDLRTYKGDHFRNIANYIGLAGFAENGNAQYPDGYVVTEQFSANPWSQLFAKTDDTQKVNYDYSERISYGGLFGQVEYTVDGFSVYAQGAVSNQSHVRWDRYGYVAAEEESAKVNNTGFNVKGGASYTFAEQHTIFANAGHYSKQPYHDNIYLNFGNDVNPLTENEKITGLEAGYRFTSQYFSANLNAYRTSWKDRVTTTSDTDEATGQQIYYNNSGVNQLHQGLELDFMAHPIPQVDIRGFASVGDWQYDDNIYQRTFDENQNLVEEEVVDVKGGKVGPAAQTSYGLGAVYRIGGGFSIDADWRNYDDMYADVVTKDNIQLPSYDLVDAGLTYKLTFPETSLTFRLNVNNVFDEVYLSEMTSANAVEAGDETYRGINVSNNVFFGNGRTWNFGMRFNF
ncbi:TonB-dependent receptor [Flavobacterium akiainvivens]|uniref:TonB-dependent receptor n=1 Tax=Flavobacterium akiainvivens TaxID=1202724 RepID=A0A0M8MJ34_9FLAO|nr:TonB-dependent receptor [Flavobacterium akiainvivens]KOS06847.1 TonB-dependent receptor [Flavobacterium akiainvivens]SFQ74949.1 Outer membrane receptor proteins, mostly Fe transport [Flavobacterium akiainvivens]